jgi:polysaccharide export outer membrane protein
MLLPYLPVSRIAAFVMLLCIALLTATATHAESPAGTTPSSDFRLGAGDVLLVTVWKQPALSMQLPVGPDGVMNYPLAGRIAVAGKTLSEVEAALTEGLSRELRDVVVNVSLTEVRSYRIYVLGEVLRPGEFILRAPVSVVQALAMANGFTPFARRDRITLVRRNSDGQEVRQPFDYAAYLAGPQSDPVLEPGDTLIVP